jgi:signal transduction histidine kinase
VRLVLERGRTNAKTLEELQAVADRAIGGVDQALTVIRTLLRIAALECGGRLAGFDNVDLAELVREVGDLYEPIAEDKHINLHVASGDDTTVRGDRDLLLEAVATLVDNAVKLTPAGGCVKLVLIHGKDESVVRVSDTGPASKRVSEQPSQGAFTAPTRAGIRLDLPLV